MLTGAQLRTVAYRTAGGIVCPDCLKPTEVNDNYQDGVTDEPSSAICAYSADEFAGDDGLYCDRCGETIVDSPELDYVVTIKLTAASGVSADTLESTIDACLDSLDTVSRVRELAVDRD